MNASQAAGPSSAVPSRHKTSLNDSQWQHTPNSSTATSDQLTPDSDSESGSDLALSAGAGLLGDGHGDTSEAYELQDRRQGEYPSDDDEKDGTTQASQKTRRKRRAASTSTAASFTLYTPDEERAVVRKFDRRLVLFVALLYMLSFLDRSSMCLALCLSFDPRFPISLPFLPNLAPLH